MSFHGEARCTTCDHMLIRDMYGCWYHDATDLPTVPHDPTPPQDVLISIRKAEGKGWQRAYAHALAKAVQHLGDNPPGYAKGREAMYQSALKHVLDLITEEPKP